MATELPKGEAGETVVAAAELLNHFTIMIDLRPGRMNVAAALAASKALTKWLDLRATMLEREHAAIAADILGKGIEELIR